MINLIPKEERKKVNKSLYYKLAVLLLFVLGFSVFVFFIAILPSYFLSFNKVNVMNAKLEAQKAEQLPELNTETSQMVKDVNNKLDIIEKAQKDKFIYSQKVINEIILKKMPEIKIIEISYGIDPIKGAKIGINGTAPSREILLLFRQAFEDDDSFSQVNLPISNFIKGSNIQFYLSLLPS